MSSMEKNCGRERLTLTILWATFRAAGRWCRATEQLDAVEQRRQRRGVADQEFASSSCSRFLSADLLLTNLLHVLERERSATVFPELAAVLVDVHCGEGLRKRRGERALATRLAPEDAYALHERGVDYWAKPAPVRVHVGADRRA